MAALFNVPEGKARIVSAGSVHSFQRYAHPRCAVSCIVDVTTEKGGHISSRMRFVVDNTGTVRHAFDLDKPVRFSHAVTPVHTMFHVDVLF